MRTKQKEINLIPIIVAGITIFGAILVLILTNLFSINNTVGKIDTKQIGIESSISDLKSTLLTMQHDFKDELKALNDKIDKIRK
jgi:hypothetical protein